MNGFSVSCLFVAICCIGAFAADPTTAPAITYVVSQQNPAALDTGPGSVEQPFKSIAPAAAIAKAGDTVLVRAGIYRETVAPANTGEPGRPLTFIAAPGEEVIVSASEVFKAAWERTTVDKKVIFQASLETPLLKEFNPFSVQIRASRGGGKQGQVFWDGALMAEALTFKQLTTQAGTWFSGNGKDLLINPPVAEQSPSDHVIELSTRRRCFSPVRRGMTNLIVRGFIFERAANDVALPQVGAVSTRSGRDWIIEGNTIRFCRTLGLDCGNEGGLRNLPDDTHPDDRIEFGGMGGPYTDGRKPVGGHLIRYNHVHDNGQCGIAGLNSYGTVCTNNLVERNAMTIPGFESAGIKFHGLLSGRVQDNVVRENGSFGIWLDCGNMGSTVAGNAVYDNKSAGIFLELSTGPSHIEDNLVWNNQGDGIYMHDDSGAVIRNNVIFNNANFGVYGHIVTERIVPTYTQFTGVQKGAPASCSDHRIENNVLIGNHAGEISLPAPSARVHGSRSDANILSPTSEREVRFVQNLKNGTTDSAEAVKAEVMRQFAKSGDPGLAATEINTFKDAGLAMTLHQWQAATGNDGATRVDTIAVPILDASQSRVELKLPDGFQPIPVLVEDARSRSWRHRFEKPGFLELSLPHTTLPASPTLADPPATIPSSAK